MSLRPCLLRPWRLTALPMFCNALSSRSLPRGQVLQSGAFSGPRQPPAPPAASGRSEEHTSELQSLMRISYAVFCLKKKKIIKKITQDRKITNTQTHKINTQHESIHKIMT